MRALLALAAAMSATLSGAQVIEQCTERAQPGEDITITADGITGATPTVMIGAVGSSGTVSTWTNCTVLSQNANVVQAQVPTTLGMGLWEVEVVTANGTSAPVFINQADVYFVDSPTYYPNATIKIYGRNLQLLGSSAAGVVNFVPTSGPTLTGRISNATPYRDMVVIPSGVVPGMTYSIQVSNGSGGTAGFVTAPTPITITSAFADPFSLNVWWCRYFSFASNVYNIQTDTRLKAHATGQGLVDDTATVQAAIWTATYAGGGVIYFPPGVYKIGGTAPISMQNNVVLEGASASQTTLEYGYNFTPTNPPTSAYAIEVMDRGTVGFYNLTLQNMSTSPLDTFSMVLGFSGAGATNYAFIKNCVLNLGTDIGLKSWGSTNIAVENSTITSTSTDNSAFGFGGDMNLTFINNTVNFRNNRLQLSNTCNDVITGNTFSRDNNYMTANCIETGCLELSGARNVYCGSNILQGTGPFPVRVGCGEMINTQYGGATEYQDLGTVTSATSTTLTNSLRNWPANFTPAVSYLFNPAMVAIIKGTGMGQYRTISSTSSSTITVSQPWNVTPDATSVYVIGIWNADHQLLVNNTITNSNYAIEFWNGALDCVADGNHVTDCGGIMLRAADVTAATGQHEHDLGWGDWISGNVVKDASGYVPANLVAYSCNSLGVPYGNGLLNAEIRSNFLIAHSPNIELPNEWGCYEAIYGTTVTYAAGFRDPYCNLGLRCLYNTCSNIATPVQTSNVGLFQYLLLPIINP